ncbi:MAG: hypothetical protein COC01_00850 [Bacteroidetes bacterium]|nr:hypothetical protein [Bacteroidia bacterium]PCH69667.1 MAG: hypothetical protein COC01_00850 [Bacteroidota bacterium]
MKELIKKLKIVEALMICLCFSVMLTTTGCDKEDFDCGEKSVQENDDESEGIVDRSVASYYEEEYVGDEDSDTGSDGEHDGDGESNEDVTDSDDQEEDDDDEDIDVTDADDAEVDDDAEVTDPDGTEEDDDGE